MEESKSDGGPPADQLTREQVMAQRAEKKKLKEARKSKTNLACNEAAGAGDESKVDIKSSKKPQQQLKEAVPKEKRGGQQKSGGEKSKSADKYKEPKRTQNPRSAPTSTPPPPVSKEKPPEVVKVAQQPVKAHAAQAYTSLPTTQSSAALTPVSKPVPLAAKSDSQCSIRSLFRDKKNEPPPKEDVFEIHEVFHNLGVKLQNDVILGSNFRCIKLLATIKEFIQLYEVPPGSTFKHGVLIALKKNLTAMRKVYSFEIGMANAIDYVMSHILKMNEDNKELPRLKNEAIRFTEQYREEKIEKAVEAIVDHAKNTIQSGDIIMVYSITEALLQLLEYTISKGRPFELILIELNHTTPEILYLLKRLNVAIENRIVRINSVNFSSATEKIRHITKLIVGGHGLFTTGGVMAQSGSADLAGRATLFNKPAVFLCEKYKFSDRPSIDFFALEDFISPDRTSSLGEGIFEPRGKFDITPAILLTVVMTDIGPLPSSTVSAVLREQKGSSPRRNDDP